MKDWNKGLAKIVLGLGIFTFGIAGFAVGAYKVFHKNVKEDIISDVDFLYSFCLKKSSLEGLKEGDNCNITFLSSESELKKIQEGGSDDPILGGFYDMSFRAENGVFYFYSSPERITKKAGMKKEVIICDLLGDGLNEEEYFERLSSLGCNKIFGRGKEGLVEDLGNVSYGDILKSCKKRIIGRYGTDYSKDLVSQFTRSSAPKFSEDYAYQFVLINSLRDRIFGTQLSR